MARVRYLVLYPSPENSTTKICDSIEHKFTNISITWHLNLNQSMFDTFITLAVVARVSKVVVNHDDMYPDTIKI